MPHVMVNTGGVGPVRLDRHEPKTLFHDQFAGDPLAHPVEFRGTVGRLAQQHNARRADSPDQGIDIGSLDRGKRLRCISELSHQRFFTWRN